MSVCPSCKAEGFSPGTPCPRCGATAVAVSHAPLPDLELDIPAPPPPKPRAPVVKKKPEDERIDLAVDLDSLHGGGSHDAPPPARDAMTHGYGAAPGYAAAANAPARGHMTRVESDDDFEARTLGDYGDPPKNIFLTPMYSWKVFKRQTELKKALVGRREEAEQARVAAEDAMVALGERVRAVAAKDPACAATLSALKQAEDLLRSRDHSLAREQDAHAERLQAIDARTAKLEQELLAAKAEERKSAAEHGDAVSTLQRAEAKLKRADIELRQWQAAQSGKRTKI